MLAIKIDLQAHSGRDIQNTIAVLEHARDVNLHSIDEVLHVLRSEIDRRAAKIQGETVKSSKNIIRSSSCPECGGGPYITLPVNSSPSTRVGGDWTHMKLCRNCFHEEWIK